MIEAQMVNINTCRSQYVACDGILEFLRCILYLLGILRLVFCGRLGYNRVSCDFCVQTLFKG